MKAARMDDDSKQPKELRARARDFQHFAMADAREDA